jgi:putative tricarboxylic transport membrane protein
MKPAPALVLPALLFACAAHSQDWAPKRNVEIVVSSVPGGSNDKTARTVERIWVQNKLVPSSITIMNKPGTGGNVAFTYVSMHPGDPHYLMVGTPGLVTGHIIGYNQLRYTDFTPIASLVNDYTVFVVNAASSIKSGKELAERLRKDPKSLTLGVGASIGGLQHIAAGLLMKAAGGNAKDLKVVAFKGSAETVTALLGGHIDVVMTAAANAVDHVVGGKLRIVGVAAPQRLGGALASAPTWKEQGLDVVYGGWRSIVGPRGLTAPQVAYWEAALRKATEYPEWKADLEKHFWSDFYAGAAQFRKFLDKDYAETRVILVELGLARSQ